MRCNVYSLTLDSLVQDMTKEPCVGLYKVDRTSDYAYLLRFICKSKTF